MREMTLVSEVKPTAAFTLTAVGLGFQAVGGLLMIYFVSYHPFYYGQFGFGTMGPWMMFGGPWAAGYSYWFPFLAIFAAAEVALAVLGVMWMNTIILGKVRTGSVLVLVASIIAFPTMFGFMIGSLLMFVGSILGLTWEPRGR